MDERVKGRRYIYRNSETVKINVRSNRRAGLTTYTEVPRLPGHPALKGEVKWTNIPL